MHRHGKGQDTALGLRSDGIGTFLQRVCLRMLRELDHVDLFVSKAATEIVRMYRQEFKLPPATRLFRDTTASAVPVGLFYYGTYHTLVLEDLRTALGRRRRKLHG